MVTELEAVAGQPPTESGKLVTIESTEKVYVRLSVSKYDLEKIAEGQKADIDIAGKTYEGTVSASSFALPPASRTPLSEEAFWDFISAWYSL